MAKSNIQILKEQKRKLSIFEKFNKSSEECINKMIVDAVVIQKVNQEKYRKSYKDTLWWKNVSEKN